MAVKPETIATERLVLKALEEKDQAALLRMAEDGQIKKTYMMPDFQDQAQKDAFFARLRALSALETRFVYGIYRDGALIGFLNDCEMDGKHAELGYFVSPDCWNRGYASEALRAAIDALFQMGYESVTAGYFEENPASRRVMEKCGMRPLQKESVINYRGRDHRCLYREIRSGQN